MGIREEEDGRVKEQIHPEEKWEKRGVEDLKKRRRS